MTDKNVNKLSLHPQKAAGLPMREDFVSKGEIVSSAAVPVVTKIQLSDFESVPSNWHIEITDDENFIRVILNSHNLILTRPQFSRLLSARSYNKGDFDDKNKS